MLQLLKQLRKPNEKLLIRLVFIQQIIGPFEKNVASW